MLSDPSLLFSNPSYCSDSSLLFEPLPTVLWPLSTVHRPSLLSRDPLYCSLIPPYCPQTPPYFSDPSLLFTGLPYCSGPSLMSSDPSLLFSDPSCRWLFIMFMLVYACLPCLPVLDLLHHEKKLNPNLINLPNLIKKKKSYIVCLMWRMMSYSHDSHIWDLTNIAWPKVGFVTLPHPDRCNWGLTSTFYDKNNGKS